MDIDLLSKMVRELILENDRVTLPGVGAFVAEMVPASFSDRGYTINPPYRRLVFRQGSSQERDSLLVDFYASANKVDREMAEKLLREFLKGMVEELKQRKMLVFTGLGRLRATKENNFFFICDENLDIFPEGMGLEPISLKSHSKPKELDFSEVDSVVITNGEPLVEDAVAATPAETPAETLEEIPAETPAETSADSSAASPVETSAEAPAETLEEIPAEIPAETPAEIPAESLAETPAEAPAESPAETPAEPRWWLGETETEDDEEKSKAGLWKKGWFVALITLGCLVLLAALAFGIFLLLAKYQPELIDRLLYTKEELDILNQML